MAAEPFYRAPVAVRTGAIARLLSGRAISRCRPTEGSTLTGVADGRNPSWIHIVIFVSQVPVGIYFSSFVFAIEFGVDIVPVINLEFVATSRHGQNTARPWRGTNLNFHLTLFSPLAFPLPRPLDPSTPRHSTHIAPFQGRHPPPSQATSLPVASRRVDIDRIPPRLLANGRVHEKVGRAEEEGDEMDIALTFFSSPRKRALPVFARGMGEMEGCDS